MSEPAYDDLIESALGELELPTEYVPVEPTAKQEWFLLQDDLEVFFGGSAGPGKLVKVDEPVATPSGWTTVGELEPGDFVFGADGAPTVVLACSPVDPSPDAYRLGFDDGSAVEACADHLWLTFDAHPAVTLPAPDGAVRTTREIAGSLLDARGRPNHAIPVALPLDLPERELPLDPYLLGLRLAGGASGDIPAAYQRGSREQRLALLQGLMDAGGCVNRGGDVEFTTTHPGLGAGAYELAVGLGQKVRVTEGPKWRMDWAASLPVFRLERKLRRQLLATGRTRQFRYITSCERVPSSPMRCIRVGNDSSLYLIGRSMIPTHNSWGLFMAALMYVKHPGYHALLLRPSLTEFEQQGGLIELSHDWLGRTDAAWHGGKREWRFPSGASVRFGYLANDADLSHYPGGGVSFLGYDELTLFTERLYLGMFRLLRQATNKLENVPLRVRSASNPGNQGHMWVRGRFIDPATREPNAVFVKATIRDNPHLDYDAYVNTVLAQMHPIDRERLINGDWDVTEEGGKFKREDFILVDEADCPPAKKSVRYWDLAGTEPNPSNPDPDFTVGLLLTLDEDNLFTIRDINMFRANDDQVQQAVRDQAEEDGRDIRIYVEQDPGQAGKPVADHAAILMGDGTYRPLREVNGGDVVIGGSGQPRRVLAVHEQGELPTVRVETFSGRVLEAALDHPVLTPSGWVDAGDLQLGMVLALRATPAITPSTIRLPEEYRLAGYFVGDGSCGPDGPSICADICCHDPVERVDIEHCVATLGFEMREGRRGKLALRSGVRKWLRETDLAGKRAYDKVVPQWVYTAPPHLAAEFIGAYFACDGTVSRNRDGSGLEFYSISRELLVGVQRILLRLGINSKIREKKGRYRETRHISYRLTLLTSDDSRARFAERVPIHGVKSELLEGFSRVRFDEPLIADRIVAITPSRARCRCLTIDEDESFLAEDFVVHNSQLNHYKKYVLQGYQCYVGQTRIRGRPAAKEVRAAPVAAAVGNHLVRLVRGRNFREALGQLSMFPHAGTHDDVCVTPDVRLPVKSGEISLVAAPLIRPGDLVLTEKSGWRPVERVMVREYTGDVIRIKTRGGMPVTVTPEHPILVQSAHARMRERSRIKQARARERANPGRAVKLRLHKRLGTDPSWKAAGDIAVGDFLYETIDRTVVPVDSLDLARWLRPERFDERGKRNRAGLHLSTLLVTDTSISFANPRSRPVTRHVPVTEGLCRLLGYYVAEGSRGRHNVSWAFHKDEEEYHADVIDLLDTIFGLGSVKVIQRPPTLAVDISVSSFVLHDFFAQFGRGARNINVPTWLMHLPPPLQIDFIKGAWRGDGSGNGDQMVYNTVSADLAVAMKQMLYRQNLAGALSIDRRSERRETPCSDMYAVRVKGADAMRLAELIGFPGPVAIRKEWHREATVIGDLVRRKVTRIEVTNYSGPVYNFAVADDATYQTEGSLVHNCDALSGAHTALTETPPGVMRTYRPQGRLPMPGDRAGYQQR